ncbi:heat stress transcription factor A-8 [Cannabis sativa]|uniref:heat stress transcription factor A-8 n=1 Tax=Cannabis sativa TaxID=3483 RepID=UPI0029CA3219|nr:heat stress transcription factor A-8 [Cannabis sativa]
MVKSTQIGDGGDGGSGSASSIAPFLKKCYEMVNDDSTDSIISWNDTNDSFVIWDMTQFSVGLLPKYFKHSNFSSFMRQLNIYGFRKVHPDRWMFANDGFIRGQKHLLKNICRRKHSQDPDQRKAFQQKESHPEETYEKVEDGLWREVENLKIDKGALAQELVNLQQHQETADNKMLVLGDRLQGMEKNQQQMLSFLVMAVQNPGLFVQLLQPKENNWRMSEAGSRLEEVTEDDNPEAASDGGMIVRYLPSPNETSNPVFTSTEKPTETSSYPDGMQDFFLNSDFMKILMDEKLSPLETHSPFILPELADDNSWEQLLLASPFREDNKDTKDDEDTNNTETPQGECRNFNYLEHMETSHNFEMEPAVYEGQFEMSHNNMESLESLNEEMGVLLSSEPENNGVA